jgi:DNA-binding PadR family transcriptional regulator
MATGEALLALLVPGPRHGYDLKRTHDEWFAGMRPLAYGQVYSTLSRLQRDGLVQVAHTETGDGPERVVYELTAAGRQWVTGWLSEPVDPAGGHAEEMIRKIVAAYRLNADPDGLMARQRAVHLRRIRAIDPDGPSGGTAELAPNLQVDHARLHLDADLRWLELAAERIRRHPAPSERPATSIEPTPSMDLTEPSDGGARR